MADQSPYTMEYRILAAVWYYESDHSISAVRILKAKLREKYDVEPPDARVIKGWSDKLFTTGSIKDKPHPGRPNERGDHAEMVTASITADTCTGTRRRSEELGISRSTMLRVMKELGYRSWKATKVQFLSPEDHEVRVACCQEIVNKYDNVRRRDHIFFSDECAIYSEGKGYLQTCMWSKANPHFYEQVRQNPPKVMVWAAMSAKHLIGPFFIDGGVTAESYGHMLRTEFVPALEAKGILRASHFQQDGAPAHTAIATRQFLNDVFPDRWIGKHGPVSWPPRSPDLTSCDNALWGMLKPKIVTAKAQSVQQLKDVIQEAFRNFPTAALPLINDRTFRRFNLCITHKGIQVDPYDK